MVRCMKTTVELPDELLLLAKRAALERGTTLRALIENGLSRELKDPSDGSLPSARWGAAVGCLSLGGDISG